MFETAEWSHVVYFGLNMSLKLTNLHRMWTNSTQNFYNSTFT